MVAEDRERFELRHTYTSIIWKGKHNSFLCGPDANLGRGGLGRGSAGMRRLKRGMGYLKREVCQRVREEVIKIPR